MAAQPPSGTVTFLLTDLEGSTRLWEQDPEAMKAAIVRHDELLDEIIAGHRGHVFSRMGDGMAAAFATARDAVAAAAVIREALAEESWATPRPLRARIGLHTDEAVVVGGSYASQPVNRCSRLMTAAHGGQVVISGATESLVGDELPEGMELLDLGEHRLRDLGRPLRVFQLGRSRHSEEFPPLRSIDAFPGNLPAQVSSFIGRHAEVNRIKAALRDSRVVTITGVGGVGKTRLALQVAADLLPRYRDGAWLVDLTAVRDPEGVAEALASVFRLAHGGGAGLEDSSIELLAHKKLLLVLDNCEHLLGPVATLVNGIERGCPGVSVLATSREGMAIDGEQLIALPPMDFGDADDAIEHLMQTDSVSLFVERARQVKADFTLTDSNARAVVQICQRLDGVPLAIELAAARVIALSPAELVRRLDRRFQVLAGGRRGAVERHATLRAAIDWSYELLEPAEQRLLARLAVFSGGCTLEAIEETCSGGPVEPDAALDLVTGLVSRSLVVAKDDGDGTRYHLLETIRQYGEERLADWGETDALVARHTHFYATFLARAAEGSYGPEQLVCVRQVNLERDNIRSALLDAIDSGDGALAVQMVLNHPHRESLSGHAMGDSLLFPVSRVVDMPEAREKPGYPRVLMVAAHQALFRGDHHAADEICQRALATERSVPAGPGPRIESNAWAIQGHSSLASGDYAGAIAGYARASELVSADGYPGLAAMYLSYSVNSALLSGCDPDEAIANAEKAVSLARQSGMWVANVLTRNTLALTLTERDPVRAKALLQESLDRSNTPGEELTQGVFTACMVSARLRDWDLTKRLTARSLYLDRMVMAPLPVAICLALCARGFAERDPEVAGVLLGAAYANFRRASASPEGAPAAPASNFVFEALRESRDLVAAALGDDRRRELRAAGAAMSMDEAAFYAIANIDSKP
jgi:predicted ATPase/class 3 adenylate cyclase